MAGRLVGKRCLIIGGTSGIGRASAERFQDEGANVAVTGLADELATPTATRLFLCDATRPDETAGCFQQAIRHLGGLDALVHVAGGSGRRLGDGPLHECTFDGWQRTLELNLNSVFLSNREALRHFLENSQGGAIVNLASVLALDPAPEHFDTCAYTAAKGAIVSLSRLAAARYAAHGIRVNVIAPGLIDTPMSRRAIDDAAIQDYLRHKQPLAKGPGQPQDVAAAALFLCSDEARLITGQVLAVDAGWQVSE